MSSNVIKGYKQNYDAANFHKLDMTVREEKLAEKIEDLKNGSTGFVSGLIPAEVIDEADYGEASHAPEYAEGTEEYAMSQQSAVPMDEEGLEAFKNEIREQLYAEVRVQAEADFRENLQAEADNILNEARAQADQMYSEAEAKGRAEGEAIKAGIISVASAEGYESGLKRAKEEQAEALRALEDEKRRVTEDYERQVELLEPAFVEILKEYVKKITGIAYEHHTEVLTYLLDQAIRRAPGQTEFIVKLSPGDMERFAAEIPAVTDRYRDKLQLNFSTSADVNEGEVRLENEGRILTSSLGLNLTGLLESLDMLSK